MRLTGPTLRRRNPSWARHQRRQLRVRDDDELDSGSEADDEAPVRFTRPVPAADILAGAGAKIGAGVIVGSGLGSSIKAPAQVPESTLAAGEEGEEEEEEEGVEGEEGEEEEEEEEEGEDGISSQSDSENDPLGVESESDADESESGDDTDAETATIPGQPAATATAPVSAIAPGAATSTIAAPPPPPAGTTGVLSTPVANAPPAPTSSSSAGSPPPVLAPIGGVAEPSTTSSTGTASSTSAPNPAGGPSGGNMSQVQPASSTAIEEVVSQITGGPTEAAASPSAAAEPTAAIIADADRLVTNSPDSATSLPESQSSPVISESGGGMETGPAVGIVFGVLAFVAVLLVGGWLLKKKMRRRHEREDSGEDPENPGGFTLPRFSPPNIGNIFRSSAPRSTWAWKFWDSNSSTSGGRSTMAPTVIPPPRAAAANKKTNSEMVDDLMRAAYAAESGENFNDLESRAGYWDEKAPVPVGAATAPPNPNYLNEKTYKALQGGQGPFSPLPVPGQGRTQGDNGQERRLTNGTNPMMRWLDGTATPHQSQFPATPAQPSSPFPPMPMPGKPQPQGGGNNITEYYN